MTAPLRVLLTRAEADAARTRAALRAAGHEVIAAPLIRIEPLPVLWPGGLVDAVLATSGHAFTALPAGWGPTPEARRLLPLLLVGDRTRACARARDFGGAATVAANATALALGLSKRAVRPRRIVFLAGRDRKPDIEAALRVTKQPFELLETYEARAVGAMDAEAVEALKGGEVDAVLHFSQRSSDLFLAQAASAGFDPAALRHCCLSEDVAKPLQAAGCKRVVTAAAPNEAALLACLAQPAP